MSLPSMFKSLQFGFPKPWMQSLIVPILKNGDKSNSSNTSTVLITPFITNLYRTILKRKIRQSWEKGQRPCQFQNIPFKHEPPSFTQIIIQECCNNKIISYVASLKQFKVPFRPRDIVIRLYENFIPMLGTPWSGCKILIVI